MKILVVDPDRIHQTLYKEIVSKVGANLNIACDASEAMKLLDSETSLLISELCLPDMDGLDLISHLRNRSDIQEMRVIVTTSLGVEAEVERASRLQVLEIWPKPLELQLCYRQLRQILCRNNVSSIDMDEVLNRLGISERLYLECLEMLDSELRTLSARLKAFKQDPQSQRACVSSALGACASLGLKSLAQLLRRLDYCYAQDMTEACKLLMASIDRESRAVSALATSIRRNWSLLGRTL